jgi:hypothetical protein
VGDGETETEAPPSRLRAFLLTVLLVVATAAQIWLRHTDYGEQEPPRPYVPPDPGVSVQELPPGTCLREPHPAGFVHPVACTDVHRSEIVALLTYPAPAGAPYPRVLDLLQQTLDPCRKAFEAYAGATAEATAARFYVVGPLLYEWARGHRTVICYAEARDGTPRNTPLRAR